MDLEQRILRLAWGLSGDKAAEKLKQFTNKPNTYIRYTDKRFTSPNPHYKNHTPRGIYGFPCKPEHMPGTMEKYDGAKDYAVAQYILIFSSAAPDKMLDSKKYKSVDFKRDRATLVQQYGEKLVKMREIVDADTALAKLARLIDNLTQEHVSKSTLQAPEHLKWHEKEGYIFSRLAQKVYESLGYIGIIDHNCNLTPSLGDQAVIFRKENVKVLAKMRNPLYVENDKRPKYLQRWEDDMDLTQRILNLATRLAMPMKSMSEFTSERVRLLLDVQYGGEVLWFDIVSEAEFEKDEGVPLTRQSLVKASGGDLTSKRYNRGYLEVVKYDNRWESRTCEASHGYGPLLYQLVMSYLKEKTDMPWMGPNISGEVSKDARKLWERVFTDPLIEHELLSTELIQEHTKITRKSPALTFRYRIKSPLDFKSLLLPI